MDADEWTRHIVSVVKKFADVSYQKETWFGTGSKVSSPEEMYCELFDDYAYDHYLAAPGIGITERQREIAIRLRDVLNEYADSVGSLSDPKMVFSDPGWELVRQIARLFVYAFEEEITR